MRPLGPHRPGFNLSLSIYTSLNFSVQIQKMGTAKPPEDNWYEDQTTDSFCLHDPCSPDQGLRKTHNSKWKDTQERNWHVPEAPRSVETGRQGAHCLLQNLVPSAWEPCERGMTHCNRGTATAHRPGLRPTDTSGKHLPFESQHSGLMSITQNSWGETRRGVLGQGPCVRHYRYYFT